MAPDTHQLTVQYRQGSARYLAETALALPAEAVALDMVYIPGGEFLMGSPPQEAGRQVYGQLHTSYGGVNVEGPQRRVSISAFLLGRYPLTQAQWRAIAALPPVNRPLKSNPSNFKGDSLPVERVDWAEAREACARLRQHTGRPYRLPSEAEWEYACRAGTDTPFHFGPSITTELANYRGQDWTYKGHRFSGAYGGGPLGEVRDRTTPVNYFDVANGFGLYDMHGNIWEWCQDRWHDTYEGAPTDGRPWQPKAQSGYRVLRGGSWFFDPIHCRSAARANNSRQLQRIKLFGLRLACDWS